MFQPLPSMIIVTGTPSGVLIRILESDTDSKFTQRVGSKSLTEPSVILSSLIDCHVAWYHLLTFELLSFTACYKMLLVEINWSSSLSNYFGTLNSPSSEIIPKRCNNCVYSSQWLYSTCFGRQFHPSSGVQCCIWPFR